MMHISSTLVYTINNIPKDELECLKLAIERYIDSLEDDIEYTDRVPQSTDITPYQEELKKAQNLLRLLVDV